MAKNKNTRVKKTNVDRLKSLDMIKAMGELRNSVYKKGLRQKLKAAIDKSKSSESDEATEQK